MRSQIPTMRVPALSDGPAGFGGQDGCFDNLRLSRVGLEQARHQRHDQRAKDSPSSPKTLTPPSRLTNINRPFIRARPASSAGRRTLSTLPTMAAPIAASVSALSYARC